MSLARVNKQHPCPVCQKDSWCLLGADVAICMRVAGPIQHKFRDDSIGWIHQTANAMPRNIPKRKEAKRIDAGAIMEGWHRRSSVDLGALADNIGVRKDALVAMGCVWSPEDRAYAFPMFNGERQCVGIRLRSIKGDKWAVTGSKQGVFLPAHDPPFRIVVVEGPTDCAAALTIGLFPIGRPFCAGGTQEINQFVKRNNVRELVIVSDNDEPGIRGATLLAETTTISNCTLILPAKDMRTFINNGGNQETFATLLKGVIWRRKKP